MNTKYHSHLSTAKKIIESYNGIEPLVFTLKKYFSKNKKHGSKDRKIIQSLCYSYYRTAHALYNYSTEEKIIWSRFITVNIHDEFLMAVRPELSEKILLPYAEKLKMAGTDFDAIFPFADELSNAIDKEKFVYSFLKQPNLFLRIRPGKKDEVLRKLKSIPVENRVESDCIELPNTFKVSEVFDLDKEVVVQDASSQQTLGFLKTIKLNEKVKAWDCCAASGGKSILLYDSLDGNVEITASDIRESILKNYKDRLQVAKLPFAKTFSADLTEGLPKQINSKFDIIICDVPCTGSGTWARTPEQLYFFSTNKIEEYAQRQMLIVQTAFRALKKDGLFFYITCSVFQKENEAVVESLAKLMGAKIINMHYIQGAQSLADTLFVAIMKI